jgi:hypothetical protein
LEVHCVVDFFDEFEADDGVVCGFFFGDARVAFFLGELVEFFDALWVEDFVDAGWVLVGVHEWWFDRVGL